MATSAASAAGSDSNRAAYARNLDSGADGNRLRLDGATLSAFDLLLDLPIFENQILPASTDTDVKPSEDLKDEDKSSSNDEDSSPVGSESNQTLVPLPITNRIEETLKRDTRRVESNERKVDPVPVPGIDEPRGSDVQTKPSIDVSNDSVPVQSTAVAPTEPFDASSSDLENNAEIDLLEPVENEPLVAVSESERSGFAQNDQNDREPVDIEVPSLDRKGKSSNARISDGRRDLETSNEALLVQQATDAKQSKKQEKRDVDIDSVKRSQSTTPFVNRRADRLAATKRGEQSDDESEQNADQNAESTNATGSIEIPKELAFDDSLSESTQMVTQSLALQGVEQPSSIATAAESSTTLQIASTPILSTGIVAAASATTSVVGLDGNKDVQVNGVGGVQGSPQSSQSSAGRGTTSLSGRGSSLSPYQEHRVLQRVLKGLEQLDDGGGQVRLRLHPPELGSLQITLRVEAQQVSALVEVEHSAARDVLLANLPQLQSRLADQGLNVSQFDVQVVDPNQFSQGSGQGWESNNGQGAGQNNADLNRSSRYLERLRNQLERSPATDATRSVQSLWTRKNGELDVRY